MDYFARPYQRLQVHLENVADLAGIFGRSVGLCNEAILAGFLHDMGKYRSEFQEYLRGNRVSSSETQHAAYGAAWAIDQELLLQAFVVAGHHSGLHDMADLRGIPNRSVLGLPCALQSVVERFQTENQLPQVTTVPGFISEIEDEKIQALRIDVAVRMLFSCLIDADRLDSALWPLRPPEDRALDSSALLELVESERQPP